MNFFILEPACNTRQTGPDYPQVQSMTKGYDFNAPDSIHALSRCVKKFPDFSPNLDGLILQKRANPTDLLSTALISAGLLISEKLKNIIQKHRIVPHQFFKCRIYHNGEIYNNYSWMHIVSDMTDKIDYKNSKFFLYKNYAHNLGYINIENKSDYFQKKTEVKKKGVSYTVWAESIKLNSEIFDTLDLFEISTFDSNYYISNKLKEELIKNNITGINIKPASNLK